MRNSASKFAGMITRTMMGSCWRVLTILTWWALFCSCFEQDFTITVEPGREDCFFHNVDVGQMIDLEYQVIDGGQGELDINFLIHTPSGRLVVSDFKKTDGAHRHEAKEAGDYKFCFGNTFSRISSKVVFFEILIDAEEENYDDGDDEEDDNDDKDNKRHPTGLEGLGVTPEEVYDMKIEDILLSITKVKNRLTRVKHFQEQRRSFEARDRNIQEHNFTRVNTWSMVQITVMVVVGLIQVVMLRSLFDDKSRVRKIWRKL